MPSVNDLRKQIKTEQKLLEGLRTDSAAARTELTEAQSLLEQYRKDLSVLQQDVRDKLSNYQLISEKTALQQGKISQLEGALMAAAGKAAGIPA